MSLINGDTKRSSVARKRRIARTEEMRALRKALGSAIPQVGVKRHQAVPAKKK